MGRLVDGEWITERQWNISDGRFRRAEAVFRSWITPDGSPGPSGRGGFEAEPSRYHLFVAMACPWAHRTLIFRKLKRLEDMISVSVADPLADQDGWEFTAQNPDPLYGVERLHQIYAMADPAASSRVTVPVLWDKKLRTIVSNESSEIIRMFNSAFDGIGADVSLDFYPPDLRSAIDEINPIIYDTVNNGVYRAGFASTQQAYEEAVVALFETLDSLEERLGVQRYLIGNRITEADWRLFTTLLRFDPVYFGHFKCNIRRIVDYPNLSGYLRELYQLPGIRDTIDLDATKRHYFLSHESINPRRIVPLGPHLDLDAPHNRDRLKAA